MLICANEARKKTDRIKKDAAANELLAIEQDIETAISKGKCYVSRGGMLSLEARRELECRGYKISSGTQYNVSYYTIEW